MISLCMIAKNEAKNLDRCLSSAKPWVDEIILVDTGSTDATMEIARQYGAKVYQHEWEMNFAKARNQAIGYASGDWIMILDADEELEQSTCSQLKELTQAPEPICAFLFKLRNQVVGQEGTTFVWHPRLFRNHVGFQYEGMVHNKPMVNGQIVRCDVTLIHYGYADPDPKTMLEKFNRRMEMIGNWVDKEPDNPMAHSYLAHAMLGFSGGSEVQARENAWKAIWHAEKALELMQAAGARGTEPHAYYPIILSLSNLHEDDRALAVVSKCAHDHPWFADPWFFATQILLRNKRWEEAEAAAFKWFEAQALCSIDNGAYLNVENMTQAQIGNMMKWWGAAQAKRIAEQRKDG